MEAIALQTKKCAHLVNNQLIVNKQYRIGKILTWNYSPYIWGGIELIYKQSSVSS